MLNHTASNGKLGEGLGMRLQKIVNITQSILYQRVFKVTIVLCLSSPTVYIIVLITHIRLTWVTRDSQTPVVKWGVKSLQYNCTKKVPCIQTH